MLAAAVLVALPAVGYAADLDPRDNMVTLSLTSDYTPSPWTQEVGYGRRALGKLGFGVKNTLLGWTELFTEPMEAENKLAGIGYGLVDGVGNTVGGLVQTITFPITGLDVPLPEGGIAII
jgi:hypothetical protein